MDEIDKSKPRRTYLITYSKADFLKFPTRESFAKAIVAVFSSKRSKVVPQHWACCLEKHSDGGYHYHVALKLSVPKRWLEAKRALEAEHGIVVNFSDHEGYYTAYQYINKYDDKVYHSTGHPDLHEIGSPKTKRCQQLYRKRRGDKMNEPTEENTAECSTSSKRKRKLSNLEVADFTVEKGIKSETELLAIANEQKEEGKKDLADFVLSRTSKCLNDLIQQTWKMKGASSTLEREKTSRMDMIRKAASVECATACEGRWLECAQEVLVKNKVHPIVFAAALRELLLLGRGKYRNIIIVGPTNCGKTFLLKPLELIFATFLNPAADKYAWVGADKPEIILLNDFRWSKELIEWKSFLLLLEGDVVKLPAPKNHFSTDVCISNDIPVFATSKSTIKYRGSYNAQDQAEDAMMASRWKVFSFFHSIPENEQKDVAPCSKCFAELVLMGEIS